MIYVMVLYLYLHVFSEILVSLGSEKDELMMVSERGGMTYFRRFIIGENKKFICWSNLVSNACTGLATCSDNWAFCLLRWTLILELIKDSIWASVHIGSEVVGSKDATT